MQGWIDQLATALGEQTLSDEETNRLLGVMATVLGTVEGLLPEALAEG